MAWLRSPGASMPRLCLTLLRGRLGRAAHDDAGPAAALVVRVQGWGEAHPPVERDRALVLRAGDGLQPRRPALRGDGGEPLVEPAAQPEGTGVVPDRDEVDVPVAGRRDEAEQVPGDLAGLAGAAPGYQGGVGELAEEDRMMQVAQVLVAPEALEVSQDLGQVTVADASGETR